MFELHKILESLKKSLKKEIRMLQKKIEPLRDVKQG